MKQIIIAKNLPYGLKRGTDPAAVTPELATTSPSDLEDGAIGIFKLASNGRGVILLTAANAAAELADTKEVFMAVGHKDGVIRTDEIQRNMQMDYRAAEYVPDTKMAIIIGATGDAGSGFKFQYAAEDRKAGMEAIVRVEDIQGGFAPYAPRKTAVYTLVSDGEDDATVVAGILKAINEQNTKDIVTATKAGDNTSITLTAKDAASIIRISLDGILSRASRKVSVSPISGMGSPASIEKIEADYVGWEGGSDPIHTWAKFPDSRVDSAVNYDTYFLKHTAHNKSFDGVNGTHDRIKHLVVAIPDAAAGKAGTAFEAIMAKVVNVTGNAAAPETATDAVATA